MGNTESGRLLLGNSHVPPSRGKLIKLCGDPSQGKGSMFRKNQVQTSDPRWIDSQAQLDKVLAPQVPRPRYVPAQHSPFSYMRGFLRGGGHSHARNPGQSQPGINTSQPPTSPQHLYQGTFDVEEGTLPAYPHHMLRLALQRQAARLDSVGSQKPYECLRFGTRQVCSWG